MLILMLKCIADSSRVAGVKARQKFYWTATTLKEYVLKFANSSFIDTSQPHTWYTTFRKYYQSKVTF